MTFLQHLGSTLKEQPLHIGVEAATVAEPIVALAFLKLFRSINLHLDLPQVPKLSPPRLTGTGPQKLSHLLDTLLPQAQTWAQNANNINWPMEEIQKWASAVVDTVNLIPRTGQLQPRAGCVSPCQRCGRNVLQRKLENQIWGFRILRKR